MLSAQINCLSNSRIKPYLECFFKNDETKLKEAIAIYTALQHRTSIFFSPIQEIEVAVRNNICRCLSTWLQHQNKTLLDFFNDPTMNGQLLITKKSKDNINQTIKRLKKRKKGDNYDENDVIAELSFGFWVKLVDLNKLEKDQAKIWRYILTDLFKHDKREFPSFKDIYSHLDRVLRFRNKLYHQEIVWDKGECKDPVMTLEWLKKNYDDFQDILQRISPERHEVIWLAKILEKQYELTFDTEIFTTEIKSLASNIED